MVRRWRKIEKYPPPIRKRIELKHVVTGIRAPEYYEGWVSTGLFLESGSYSIKQTEDKSVDFNKKPTHWRELKR
jgi:hypothetical protein